MSEQTKEIAKRHTQRQMKKRKRFKIFSFMLLIVLAFFLITLASILTPVFNVKSVAVEGASIVRVEDVEAALGINSDMNFFTIDKKLMKKRVEALPYVKSAEITRRIYGKVVVKIVESKASGYVKGEKDYVVFDDGGEVVDIAITKPENLFELKGVNLQKIQLGEKINIDYSEKFDIILLYISELEKAGIKDKMTLIDVGDHLSVKGIYDNRYDILFGDKTNLEHKVSMLAAAISHNAPNEMGTIDLRISNNAYLKPDRIFGKEKPKEEDEEKKPSEGEKVDGEDKASENASGESEEDANSDEEDETSHDASEGNSGSSEASENNE